MAQNQHLGEARRHWEGSQSPANKSSQIRMAREKNLHQRIWDRAYNRISKRTEAHTQWSGHMGIAIALGTDLPRAVMLDLGSRASNSVNSCHPQQPTTNHQH